jgi:hypothetical protein
MKASRRVNDFRITIDEKYLHDAPPCLCSLGMVSITWLLLAVRLELSELSSLYHLLLLGTGGIVILRSWT